MKIIYLNKQAIRFTGLILALLLSGSLAAQFPNPDASLLFSRSTISGTSRVMGMGGAFSSVGADPSCMDLNPAGLGLYRSSDISITPGVRIAADQSIYNNNSMSASHPSLEFAQAGAVITKKFAHSTANGLNPYSLNSLTFGINFQTENSFDRNQNFGALNQTNSLVDKYTTLSNNFGTNQWSLEAAMLGATSFMGQNPITNAYFSNLKAPVQQSGFLNTRGATNKINIGLGGNIGDKIFFGLSLGIPILNYTVNTQMVEINANPNDTVSQFQGYLLNSTVSETGVGVTGKVGLIYKPVPWARFGVSYSLPTWYFMTENYSSEIQYGDSILDGSEPALSYQMRTPMKGTVGASFYLKEHGFISIDYEFQNLGSTHYHFTDPRYSSIDTSYNSYMKSVYGYSHTIKVGLEGAIKQLRLRAGYSYTNTPFIKSKMNYSDASHNGSAQSATVGIGGRFKRFYIDLAYVFTYTKDAVSPNFQIPLDQINSTYMTHNIMLTLGFRLSRDESKPAATKERQKRSSDQLPKYLDPGDKY